MTRLVPDETYFGDRAPVTEALIDIRVSGNIDLESLRALGAELEPQFPVLTTQLSFEFEVRADTNEEVSRTQGVRGYLCRSLDGGRVVQLRVDGFTFSKLRPYSAWGDVRREALHLWQRYLQVAKPSAVTRIAVRYINHIVPPAGWSHAAEWLTMVPRVPQIPNVDGGDGESEDFVMRVILVHPTEPHKATVTVGTAQDAATGGNRGLLLDIDVSLDVQLAPDEDAIWQRLDLMRDFKNDVFFATTTKAARSNF